MRWPVARIGYFSVKERLEILSQKKLLLLPEGALWWEPHKILVVSDVHMGKATHFRQNGIPVPWQEEFKNLKKLSFLLKTYQVQKLIFLGDLFHSHFSYATDAFAQWRRQWKAVEMVLVQGNHDLLSPESYARMALSVVPSITQNGVHLSHFPEEGDPAAGELVVAGHLHPGLRVGRRHYPCFWFSGNRLIAPAFGSFTGFFSVKPGKGDRVVVSYNQQLWLLAF
ncbi:MAG: ligase-associated DNA damage response endonuclease PdeM [Flavobacteriales bacterium]|nr:ligase-associated DNA damage response endonuclease PdeM [Flavobacteriales bacterium]